MTLEAVGVDQLENIGAKIVEVIISRMFSSLLYPTPYTDSK
jgi:hypothetical protein